MSTPLNQSVLKGFRILSLFSANRNEISAETVVARLGMSTATAHRFLVTLERAGALRITRRGHFALGQKIEELGWIAGESGSLSIIVQPEIDILSSALNESVMACRLTRFGPSCVAVANSSRPISVNISVGTLLPLHTTAQGKLWLSQMSPNERRARLAVTTIAGARVAPVDPETLENALKTIRKRGYALNLGENEPDIAALAVPVKDGKGKTRLTISVFGMLSRFNQEFLDTARAHLMEASTRIGGQL